MNIVKEIVYNSSKVQVMVECTLEEMGDLHLFIEKLKKELQPDSKIISVFEVERIGCGEKINDNRNKV